MFYDGIATSIKTIDLRASSYKTGNKVFSQLKRYIDALYAFNGKSWGLDIVKKNEIRKKVLEVGIPRGASETQISQLHKAVIYAKSKQIQVNIRIVE